MTHTIIKPDPDEDFYAIWCDAVDRPVDWGTREQLDPNRRGYRRPGFFLWLKASLEKDHRTISRATGVKPGSFELADEVGSSSRIATPGGYDWGSDAALYFDDPSCEGRLPREAFPDFLVAYLQAELLEDDDERADLLDPFLLDEDGDEAEEPRLDIHEGALEGAPPHAAGD